MEETSNARAPGRPGRRKGSGKRAGAEGAWGVRAVQALADPSRWRILLELSVGPRTLADLAVRIQLSAACTSHHVSILKDSELVVSRRDGRSMMCSGPAPGSRAAILLELITELPYLSKPMPLPHEIRPHTGAPELEPARHALIRNEEFVV